MGDNNQHPSAGKSSQPGAGSSGAATAMQQLQPRFIVTGFGCFSGVERNPTEQLVQWLRQRAACSSSSDQPSQCYSISSMDVLEVSAEAVDKFVQTQQQLLLQHATAAGGSSQANKQPVVLLHFGVDTQRPAISLELQAYNNATFSCPDQCGWQPKACLIEPAPGLGTSSVRATTLPLQELVQQLRDAGFECGASHDAGRFVCNYTYYKSLQMTSRLQQQLMWQQQQPEEGAVPAASNGQAASPPDNSHHSWPIFSLFVHMPSFDVVNQARQREFVLTLLDLVSKWVSQGGASSNSSSGSQQPAAAVVAE